MTQRLGLIAMALAVLVLASTAIGPMTGDAAGACADIGFTISYVQNGVTKTITDHPSAKFDIPVETPLQFDVKVKSGLQTQPIAFTSPNQDLQLIAGSVSDAGAVKFNQPQQRPQVNFAISWPNAGPDGKVSFRASINRANIHAGKTIGALLTVGTRVAGGVCGAKAEIRGLLVSANPTDPAPRTPTTSATPPAATATSTATAKPATATASATLPAPPSRTATPTATVAPATASPTTAPSNTPTATATAPTSPSSTSTPSRTPSTVPSNTTTRTATPVAATATATTVPANTATATTTVTNTPVNTATRTATPVATATATATATQVATATPTATIVVPGDVVGAIVPGGPSVSMANTLANQNMRLTFSGMAGQRVSLLVANSALANAVLTLQRPDSSTQSLGSFGAAGVFVDTVSLPATGGYALLIDPVGTAIGGATFTLYNVPADATGTIVPDGPATSIANTVPGQNMRLGFSGTAGLPVSLWVIDSTLSSAYLTLRHPDGSVQSLGRVGSSGGFYGPVTLPATGAYTVIVDPEGPAVGGAAFTLITGYDVIKPIAPNGPAVALTIPTPSQMGRLLFQATAGQRISLGVSASSLTSAYITLVRPNASTQSIGSFGPAGGFFDVVELPLTGAYYLLIDPALTYTGGATFTLHLVPADATGPVVPGGAAVTIANTVVGQDMRLTFAATAGQRISLRVTNSSLTSGYITLIRPDDSTQAIGSVSLANSYYDTITLPQTGAYTLWINPVGTHIGGVTMTVYNLPADAGAAVTIGGPGATLTTTVPGQDMQVTFTGTAGQSVRFLVNGSTIASGYLTLVRPGGSTQNIGSITTGDNNKGPATLTDTGTYTLQLDINGAAFGSATMAVITG